MVIAVLGMILAGPGGLPASSGRVCATGTAAGGD